MHLVTALNRWLVLSLMIMGVCMAGPSVAELPSQKNTENGNSPQLTTDDLLKKQVSFESDSTLEQVLGVIQKKTGVTVNILDRDTIAWTPVRLSVSDRSLASVLDLIIRKSRTDFQLAWTSHKGLIYIGTAQSVNELTLVTRVYDVRALSMQIPKFGGSDMHKQRVPDVGEGSHAYDGGVNIFGASEGNEDDYLTPGDVAGIGGDYLAELVRSSVDPEGWRQNGGLTSTLTIRNGIMVVKTGSDNQQKIKDLLVALQNSYGKMIAIEATFVAARRSMVQSTLEKAKGGILNEAELKAFLGNVDSGQKSFMLPLSAMRTTCMNAQQVAMTAGNERSFVSHLEPVVSSNASGNSPSVSAILSGTVLQLRPAASFDNRFVNLQIQGNYNIATLRKKAPFLTSAGKEGVKLVESRSGSDDNVTQIEAELGGSDAKKVQYAAIELPESDIATFRTMVALPDGGGVLLSSSSMSFDFLTGHPKFRALSEHANDLELALVVQVRIVENDAK